MPVPLSLNPVLWLKADAGVTSSGGLVSAWADQSGYGNNASQSTDSRKPTYFANAQNGLPGLVFDGTDAMALSISAAVSDWMAFVVFNPLNTPGTCYLIDAQTGRFIIALGSDTIAKVGWYDGSWKRIAIATTGWQTLCWKLTATGEMFRDGVSLGTGAYTQKAIGGTVVLGTAYDYGAAFVNANIGELLLFPSALSDSDRLSVETYLYNRWFVPPTTPVASRLVRRSRIIGSGLGV